MEKSPRDDLDVRELLGWAEFCSWTALVLSPVIWWLQGPSVSNDQFVARTALISIAGTGAIVLRATAFGRRFRHLGRDLNNGPGPADDSGNTRVSSPPASGRF